MVLAIVFVGDEGRLNIGRGANLDVIFERQVSVRVRPRAVHGHGLPLSWGSSVVGPAGPLSFLHLDGVKRWGYDCPGSEPHQSR